MLADVQRRLLVSLAITVSHFLPSPQNTVYFSMCTPFLYAFKKMFVYFCLTFPTTILSLSPLLWFCLNSYSPSPLLSFLLPSPPPPPSLPPSHSYWGCHLPPGRDGEPGAVRCPGWLPSEGLPSGQPERGPGGPRHRETRHRWVNRYPTLYTRLPTDVSRHTVWKSISTDGMCLPNQVHALQAQIWGIIL